ncbi:MAG: non-ribosomal peptide synthetase [Pseudomonadota bacterium]
MKRYDALSEVLLDARHREQTIQFIDGETDITERSTSALYDEAIVLLGRLQSSGMTPGDELVIFTKSNHAFTVAFWAAVLGGLVPVPVAVGISDEHRFKLFRILRQLQQPQLLTEPELRDKLVDFARTHEQTAVLEILNERTLFAVDIADGDAGVVATVSPEDLAFIQYSSGSTGDPKGVCLSHLNVCTNIRAIAEGADWGPQERSLSWMPLTHDMGLIGYHLTVLAAGMDHAIMDTSAFVRRPLLWMIKASEFQATQLCSPNFGYKHFLKLFERKGLPQEIDLSRIKLILNGAEPISVPLCEAFMDALEPYGLPRKSMFPVYGLAEATVGVSMGERDKAYQTVSVDRHHLAIGEQYVACDPASPDALLLVKVGSALRDVQIRIVDDADQPLPDAHIGHILLKGESITSAIYQDPTTTAALFADDAWLRSGDCGMIVDGDLVITGRQKDLIILNGQNYYPHDLETILEKLDGLDLGKVVVAGSGLDASNDTESLLVFVLHRGATEDIAPLAIEIRRCLAEAVGIEVDHVIPVARIPNTTSGKVQRAHLVREYAAGDYAHSVAVLSPPDEDTGKPPADGEEALVAELLGICNSFTGGVSVGADDNLFEIGVSSLTLSEVVLGIDEKFPGMLDISDLFDVPSVREIAAFLREKGI